MDIYWNVWSLLVLKITRKPIVLEVYVRRYKETTTHVDKFHTLSCPVFFLPSFFFGAVSLLP